MCIYTALDPFHHSSKIKLLIYYLSQLLLIQFSLTSQAAALYVVGTFIPLQANLCHNLASHLFITWLAPSLVTMPQIIQPYPLTLSICSIVSGRGVP